MARSTRRSVLTAHGQSTARETRSSVFNAHGKRARFPFAASPPVQVRTSSVEIPASEAGNHWLDCPSSQIFRGRGAGGPRLMDYHSVQVRKVGVERLARKAGGNGAVAETGRRPRRRTRARWPLKLRKPTRSRRRRPLRSGSRQAGAGGSAVAAPPLSRRPAGHAA